MRDFLQKWKVECSADSLVPMRFAIFPVHLSKVLRPPRKIDTRSYEVLHMSRKIIVANLQIWCSKRQPFSGNGRPDLLTSLMNMSFVLRLPGKMHLCRSSSKAPCLPSFLALPQNLHALLTFDKIDNPLHLPRGTTTQRRGVLYLLTSKCASRHNGGFKHRNFQKWSEHGVFCAFWLRNVLRATTACKFSSLIWPAGSAPAALASLLFDPPEPQIIGKTQCFATFLPFRASAFFSSGSFSSLIFSLLIFLFSLPLPCSAFHLSILWEVWLLSFDTYFVRLYLIFGVNPSPPQGPRGGERREQLPKPRHGGVHRGAAGGADGGVLRRHAPRGAAAGELHVQLRGKHDHSRCNLGKERIEDAFVIYI